MAQVDKLCSALEHKEELISYIKKQLNIKKPRPKLKVPTIHDIIQHTRNSNFSTVKYFTTGRPISNFRDLSKEPCPFGIDNSQNFLSNISFKPPRIAQNRPKHAYRNDYKKNDILNRVHIPDKNIVIPPSKLDNNSEYFSLVKGRPIKEKFDKRHFAVNHRRCFFKKLCAGFLEDEIKKQEEHHIRDLWRLYTIREELDKIIQSFENYLTDDHQESVKIIEESQQIAHLKDEKTQEVKRSSGYLNAIKCTLYKMEEQLTYRKYCKEAIYNISPTHWQEEFERSKEAYKPKAQEMAEDVFEHYQEFLNYTPEEDKFLDKLVNDLITDIVNLGPPAIYFQHPWEVDMVFKEFELQNLHAAKHLADVGHIQKDLKGLLKHVKEYYKIEFMCLQEKIKDLEAGILYQKERSLELEAIARQLTQTVYKDVVSADHILETQGLVHNMYDEIIGEEETKLSYVEMMERVETEIVNVWKEAHEMPRYLYEEYEEKIKNRTKAETYAALEAKRRERRIVLTVSRLHRSYMPPHKTLFKKLLPRSDPPPMIKRFERMKLLRRMKELEIRERKKKALTRGELWDEEHIEEKEEEEGKKISEVSKTLHEEEKIEESFEDRDKIERDLFSLTSDESITKKENVLIGPKIVSCYKKQPRIHKPHEELIKVQPKIAIAKHSIPDIIEKFRAHEEDIFMQKFDSRLSEPDEALPMFKGYNYNFDRVIDLHKSLVHRIAMYKRYSAECEEEEMRTYEDVFHGTSSRNVEQDLTTRPNEPSAPIAGSALSSQLSNTSIKSVQSSHGLDDKPSMSTKYDGLSPNRNLQPLKPQNDSQHFSRKS
ncbi:golgin subfamily A member 6-like protein 6 isoform X2 [Cimex lectularius]|nr:golgin subfamily A member 6-like protein 6 isoform X2 [Cimex lectularius]